MQKKNKFLIIVGARPNFVKIAPLLEEFKRHKIIRPILVHTGQHYDFEMSQVFFQELKIPKPNYNLGIGSGSHTWQTAKVMEKLEPVIVKERPDLVIVVGDVNSTLAGALVAAKLHISVAHIEAGLRSFDRTMPEEINRLLTDQIADYLFATEPSAIKNLLREGISRDKIFYVGNIMIDTLKNQKSKIKNIKSKILTRLNLKPKQYAVLTLHRPNNVDDKKTLKNLLEVFGEIQKKIKIIYPIHPRTKKQIKKFDLEKLISKMPNFIIIPPLGYLENLTLMNYSKFVLTDSGGIQEETTVLNVPCLILRKNTERPITVQEGTNIVVGTDKNKIIKESSRILNGKYKKRKNIKFWDGRTSQRIKKILLEKQNQL